MNTSANRGAPLKSILKTPYMAPKLSEMRNVNSLPLYPRNYKKSIYEYFVNHSFFNNKNDVTQKNTGDQIDPYSLYVFRNGSCFRRVLI